MRPLTLLLASLCLASPVLPAPSDTPPPLPAHADLVVYGATPGGIVTAVSAARQGLEVVLVSPYPHVGGLMSNGLGLLDTVYDGVRAPLLEEIRQRIESHYAHLSEAERLRGYEPHVAEEIFESLLAAESAVTVVRSYHPATVERNGRRIAAATFQAMNGETTVTLRGNAFVDASYEGDLAAVAGVAMTAGREGRDEYGEPHAGRVFTRLEPTPQPSALEQEGLNLRTFSLMANDLLPGSTGEADNAIQAYNFRVCLTRDPANRVAVGKPDRYERDLFFELRSRWKFTNRLPGQKTSWNAPLLVAGNFAYPDGDWSVRREIVQRHQDLALGLLWFLQHDPEVPAEIQAEAREWGLPRDEFADNGHFPWELYIREARRLVGRHVLTQHDAQLAAGLGRAPVHPDSIAITEWPMDSHSCHNDVVPGSDHEGKIILTEETRPAQVPYRSLLPEELDNLLVTVCLSSTHVAWGTVRLEPVWMHVGESAAVAVALAAELEVAPADVPVAALRERLVAHNIMIGFFNDFDMQAPTPVQRAAQLGSTRGFFASYDARLDAPLTRAVAQVWTRPDVDPMATARRVARAERQVDAEPVTAAELAAMAGLAWPAAPTGPVTRGQACAWLMATTAP